MNVSTVFSAGCCRILCVVGILWSLAATQAAEPKRVALVIGNSEYEASPLKNPSNDADAVALALKGLGFTVTTKKGVTKAQFENAVDDITENLQSGDVCLIFYAGHGQGFENENYLIPVDAVLERPQHVEERCVSVSYLLRALRFSECSLKIVVVDACRNNPFRSFSRSEAGLAEISNAPDGTIVSFSTSPKTPALDGNGDNSPYVKHLVKAMTTRADEVEIVRLFRETSQAVKTETGQRPFLEFDASMPDYFLKRRRDAVPDSPTMQVPPTVPDLLTNSIGMKMKLIPAGEFLMGSPSDEGGRYEDEGPQHKVRITRAFYMGVTEVTQGQWFAVMKTKPWEGKDYMKDGENYPATYVSWDDAIEYCQKLSESEGKRYRLPTEAEWEYACRGGKSTAYSFGSDASGLQNYAWFAENALSAGESYAHIVGAKQSNSFGLYDTHGNVWEWCSDWYDNDYYATSPESDPPGATTGSHRVLRGGGWNSVAANCRAAHRSADGPTYRNTGSGFRLALSPSGK